ncbi:uncharacterized protein PHACADRAFT_211659 [Phanerochaete carnosa HHB-10118-sp]|uniref:Secreted protein n=1 Tax=Phanerochaete carnosa (strain HHB-10118-sp) TaxID=650164 RepID=K5WPZ6_PHACS|nr:uncharacterized protein PHACADRAFT_211659 [Phanerochaete carnosa HHB-10118-sp]EKM52407.1 hypothetical protein PHACADRAFT_211659 [Phanerochaete carnosa HHB-10118-sp]
MIFTAIAVFTLILCLLLRLMCLRSESRPLQSFLTPLPPPQRDREALPHPSHSKTRSEQIYQTIFLSTLPIAAPQPPPAMYTVPGVPALAPRRH